MEDNSNLLDKNTLNNKFSCKDHEREAYAICLSESRKNNRLLCRICKQNLLREELTEVISLTDFLSGNFLNAAKGMAKEEQNMLLQDQSEENLEQKFGTFFEDLKKEVFNVLNNAKSKVFNKYRELNSPLPLTSEIDSKVEALQKDLETMKNSTQERFPNNDLLSEFVTQYEAFQEYARIHSKFSAQQIDKNSLVEKLNVNNEGCQDFKNRLIKIFTSFLRLHAELEEDEVFLDPIFRRNPHTAQEIQVIHEATSQNGHISISETIESPREIVNNAGGQKNQRKRKANTFLQGSLWTNKEEEEITFTPKCKKLKKTPVIINVKQETPNKLFSLIPTPGMRKITIQESKTLEGNYSQVLWGGLCYIPKKEHIVAGDELGNIFVWGLHLHILLFTRTTDSKIYCMRYLEPRESILVACEDGRIHIFDMAQNYMPVLIYQAHTSQIFAMTYIQHMDLIASAGKEKNISLWTYSDKSADEHKTLPTDVQISSLCSIESKKLLAAGTMVDGNILVFDLVTKFTKTIFAHNKSKSIDCLVYVPEWNVLVSGSEDSYIKFWDVSEFTTTKKTPCQRYLKRNSSFIQNIVIIPSENYLIHTNLDQMITVWDLTQEKEIDNILGSQSRSNGEAMIYLQHRKELVTSFGEEIKIWTLQF